MITIEPGDGCDNTPERFEIDGFECPYCNGRGRHRVYVGKDEYDVACSRCSGSGRLKAVVRIDWKQDLG